MRKQSIIINSDSLSALGILKKYIMRETPDIFVFLIRLDFWIQ